MSDRVESLSDPAAARLPGQGRPRGRARNIGSGRDDVRANAPKDELIEKLVTINRVAKVVKGGRRFAFAALVVVGDGKGRVGFGKGKAREVPEAIRKATAHATSSMIRIRLHENRTLYHDSNGRAGAGRILVRAAKRGTGVIAGGAARAVFMAAGIHDVVAKSHGTSNPINVVAAAFDALGKQASVREVAQRRGLTVGALRARMRGKIDHNLPEIKVLVPGLVPAGWEFTRTDARQAEGADFAVQIMKLLQDGGRESTGEALGLAQRLAALNLVDLRQTKATIALQLVSLWEGPFAEHARAASMALIGERTDVGGQRMAQLAELLGLGGLLRTKLPNTRDTLRVGQTFEIKLEVETTAILGSPDQAPDSNASRPRAPFRFFVSAAGHKFEGSQWRTAEPGQKKDVLAATFRLTPVEQGQHAVNILLFRATRLLQASTRNVTVTEDGLG